MVDHTKSYPGLVVTLHLGDITRSFLLDGKPAPNPATVPSWVKGEEFAGIVADHGEIALRSMERIRTPAGDLTLILSQPFTSELLDLVGNGIGPVTVTEMKQVSRRRPTKRSIRVETGGESFVPFKTISSKSLSLPEPEYPFDVKVVGASPLEPIVGAGTEQKAHAPVYVNVYSRIATLNARLLATLGDLQRVAVLLFKSWPPSF